MLYHFEPLRAASAVRACGSPFLNEVWVAFVSTVLLCEILAGDTETRDCALIIRRHLTIRDLP